MLEHERSKVTHDRFGLDVEVAEHLIAAPPADKANRVRVDVGTQEGHGSGRSKGARGDVVSQEAKCGTKEGDGQFQGAGDVGRRDSSPAVGKKEPGNREGEVGTMLPGMKDSADKAEDRA